jgi:hypothetical protein
MAAVPNHEKSIWQHFQFFLEFVAHFWQQIFFFLKMLPRLNLSANSAPSAVEKRNRMRIAHTTHHSSLAIRH